MKIILPTLAAVSLIGCATVSDVENLPPTGSIPVAEGSEICVVTPEDALYAGKTQRNSGQKVGEVISKSIPEVYTAVQVSTPDNCASNILVSTEILEYENRASGWSGMPDKIRVKVVAKDIAKSTDAELNYYADTNMAASALFEWGNAAPYKLLDRKFKKQLELLFAE